MSKELNDKERKEAFNIEAELLAAGCDEMCYYYCTKGEMKNPSCLRQAKS